MYPAPSPRSASDRRRARARAHARTHALRFGAPPDGRPVGSASGTAQIRPMRPFKPLPKRSAKKKAAWAPPPTAALSLHLSAAPHCGAAPG
eukprot:scaffold388_cov380-Prasinococcus_capsulatus_cf.AAC.47